MFGPGDVSLIDRQIAFELGAFVLGAVARDESGLFRQGRIPWGYLVRVFVTVGTHNQGFEFMLEKLTELSEEHELIIQSGHSKTVVEKARSQKPWFTQEEMQEEIKSADLVIAHMGCGIAREVQVAGRASIFFCREKKRAEHFDDHQLELKKALKGRRGLRFYSEGDELTNIIEGLGDERPTIPAAFEELLTAVKEWLA
jgi:UDP-N-acetylglucosamine transferase subunit ALG13